MSQFDTAPGPDTSAPEPAATITAAEEQAKEFIEGFRVLVAKGVHAPVAAYREVCKTFIRVNTPGVTCADMTRQIYHHRRRPLFPFEEIPAK